MSDFWICSDLPVDDITVRQSKAVIAWAEAEVERACRDLMDHIALIDGPLSARTDDEPPLDRPYGLSVRAFLVSPWGDDSSMDLRHTQKLLSEVVMEAVDGETRGDGTIERDGSGIILEAELTTLQMLITDALRRFRDPDRSPQGQDGEAGLIEDESR